MFVALLFSILILFYVQKPSNFNKFNSDKTRLIIDSQNLCNHKGINDRQFVNNFIENGITNGGVICKLNTYSLYNFAIGEREFPGLSVSREKYLNGQFRSAARDKTCLWKAFEKGMKYWRHVLEKSDLTASEKDLLPQLVTLVDCSEGEDMVMFRATNAPDLALNINSKPASNNLPLDISCFNKLSGVKYYEQSQVNNKNTGDNKVCTIELY